MNKKLYKRKKINNQDVKIIIDSLRNKRESMRLSQGKIAEMAGISYPTYSSFENYYRLSLDSLKKIATYYQIAVSKLTDEIDRKELNDLTMQEIKTFLNDTCEKDLEVSPYRFLEDPKEVRIKALYYDTSIDKTLREFFDDLEAWKSIKPKGIEVEQFLIMTTKIDFQNLKPQFISILFDEIRKGNQELQPIVERLQKRKKKDEGK